MKISGIHYLKNQLKSLGFLAMIRGIRVFAIYPKDDTVYIFKAYTRPDYWSVNKVSKSLWDKYGGEGYTIIEYTTTNEIVKLFCQKVLEDMQDIDEENLAEIRQKFSDTVRKERNSKRRIYTLEMKELEKILNEQHKKI